MFSSTFHDTATPHRRTTLKALLTLGAAGASGFSHWAFGQTSSATDTLADEWRAMSRVGYGVTPGLILALRNAGGAKAWAMAQIDVAALASQRAAAIEPELAEFNASLPTLIAGHKREREVRKERKANTDETTGAARIQRMDFSGENDPAHFSRRVVQKASAWRLMSASNPDLENPLLARLTEFWFNHFNVSVAKGAVRPYAGHYLVNVARTHALSRFEDLLLASARHPAMLEYLDQAQSVAEGSRVAKGKTRGLNENYARELMELHTLGVDGGYNQTDVRELARVLTGWTVDHDEASGFRFAPRFHDAGSKTVLGRTFGQGGTARGDQEGIEALRMLARHPSTAKRVSLRLAQFFIADNPPAAVVERLRSSFMATQGDIRAVMRVLLQAPEFWATENRMFKSPFDFAASALAATHSQQVGDREIGRRALVTSLGFLNNAGQPLLGWQTPDGYKFDAATWLVPEALTRRADYALSIARNTPELEYLSPYLSPATLDTVAREKPGMRAGLALASPDFMNK
jgi:uncharacterized protein (DUF1800 family)